MLSAPGRLHALLVQLRPLVEGSPLDEAWGEVLAVPAPSEDFDRRHAEVIGLTWEAHRSVADLPQASRQRYRRHLPDWWRLVLGPKCSLDASLSDWPSDAIDALGFLADLTDAKLQFRSVEGDGQRLLSDLREECVGWLTLIDETRDLRQGVADALKGQIQHLIWLVDHVEHFGTSAILREATDVTATVLSFQDDLRQPQDRRRWKTAVASLTVACLALTGFTKTTLTPMLEAAVTAVEQVNQLQDGLRELADSPATGEVIDGEVVQDTGDAEDSG